MARTYAGILGSLALVVTLLRGVMAGGGVEETLLRSVVSLVAFMLIGAAAGGLADWLIEDAVYEQVQREVAAQESSKNKRSEITTTR